MAQGIYVVDVHMATLVTLSRVFVGKHYLGDVLAGALIGTITGYVFAALASRICRRF